MATPPPLPAVSGIRHAIFIGQFAGGIRLAGPKLLLEQIEDAHRKAEAWMNSHPGIEIVSISNGSASSGDNASAVFVTVWYPESL
ncbi:hypothetical protein [Luteolibacter marinus]|uniref:hypothetical protein n=1 Tax=Luteolibacter marinus TaxID=2776705 RepID=UPI001868FCC9|nr:hypothetical protein [Luteolibacter marinus]